MSAAPLRAFGHALMNTLSPFALNSCWYIPSEENGTTTDARITVFLSTCAVMFAIRLISALPPSENLLFASLR